MDVTMGNQHAMPLLDIVWLSGLFDGEGSITIRRHAGRNRRCFIPRVSISSTDPNIILRVKQILALLGVTPYIYEQDRAEWKKICFHIQTNKRAHCKILMEAMLPYLVGKKARAELMLSFLDAQKCSEEETVFTELTTANHRGKPSETTREALVLSEMKI